MTLITNIGSLVTESFARLCLIFTYLGTVVWVAFDRRHWSITVRRVFVDQIYFSAVKAIGLLIFVSLLAGVALVYPVQMWLGTIGQSALLGQVLVALVVNQIGPLLVGFILIGRSGSAICAELAGMRSRGEIHVLDTQGIDPMVYLVMPRVLALAISCFVLTMVFVLISLLTGWVHSVLAGVADAGISRFGHSLFMSLRPEDLAAFAGKSFAGGLLIGVICCVEGIATGGLSTEIPQAVTRGVVESMTGLIIFSVIVSFVNYIL